MKSAVNWIRKEIRRRELEISKSQMGVGRPAVRRVADSRCRRVGEGGWQPRAGSLRDEMGRTVEYPAAYCCLFFTWRTKESNR